MFVPKGTIIRIPVVDINNSEGSSPETVTVVERIRRRSGGRRRQECKARTHLLSGPSWWGGCEIRKFQYISVISVLHRTYQTILFQSVIENDHNAIGS